MPEHCTEEEALPVLGSALQLCQVLHESLALIHSAIQTAWGEEENWFFPSDKIP